MYISKEKKIRGKNESLLKLLKFRKQSTSKKNAYFSKYSPKN